MVRAPAFSTRSTRPSDKRSMTRSANATVSSRTPASSASWTRCSPSSRMVPSDPDARASSRKRATIGFCRLETRCIDGIIRLRALCALRRDKSGSRATARRPCYHLTEMKAQILKKFEEEIQRLDRELKADLPKEIQRARELGDLRENAEYHAAKERQRLVEARISLLQKRVSEISLMNLDKLPRDRVGFGSTVHLKDPKEQTITYQLVMPEDADVDQGLISTASPIGRALLNKEEGDEVVVTTPNGSKRFEIVKLMTIHDEA